MKYLFYAILVFCTSFSFAQSSEQLIIKKWKLVELEEFGEKYALTDTQQNDWITFKANHEYSGKINGKDIEGKWSANGNSFKMVKGNLSDFKVNWFKITEISKSKLAITYQSTDLIKTSLFYIPANN